jgi:heat-inducible transcriptional repressor
MKLKNRREEILKTLVSEYIKTGQPVGSTKIAEKFRAPVSSATIRNEMTELEELGYIYQPHISAGRIPTSKGYRFFIETFLKEKKEKTIKKIELSVSVKTKDLNFVLEKVSKFMSQSTKEIALVLSPETEDEHIKYVHFFAINNQNVYTVLVTDTYTSEAAPIVETKTSQNELAVIEHLINDKLSNLSLKQASRLLRKTKFFLEEFRQENIIIKAFYQSLEKEIRKNATREIYIKGIANLLSARITLAEKKVEFLLKMLEEKRLIEDIIEDVPLKDNLGYLIGKENKLPQLWDCSLITVKYTIKEMEGMLALIGPTRMDYIKGIYVLEQIADSLEEFANKIMP